MIGNKDGAIVILDIVHLEHVFVACDFGTPRSRSSTGTREGRLGKTSSEWCTFVLILLVLLPLLTACPLLVLLLCAALLQCSTAQLDGTVALPESGTAPESVEHRILDGRGTGRRSLRLCPFFFLVPAHDITRAKSSMRPPPTTFPRFPLIPVSQLGRVEHFS